MAACMICHAASAKYKCPRCFERYCSVACCKSHKEKECIPQVHTENIDDKKPLKTCTGGETNLSWSFMEETEDRVPQEKLQNLCKSENLKGMLHNQHLRAMMENLVNSIDPMADMEDAMQEPIFVELADECLRIVEGDKEPDMASVSK
ncbi:hypothetical protein C0Q70_08400 [Pomacea canaliculata]|uniref:Zinc finger HIT domain-containing protein 3 n=1 Tax=Pomacea canaliculata TaxID=400727 RepID=A0A2T7PHQ3_POMCA|nr:zinc finger HIT domain-containing protein 3-like [Pomacea canaliculata]PVD32953.1 hypothetical protein C0Q70_08400 [Pomacea canaliculata]